MMDQIIVDAKELEKYITEENSIAETKEVIPVKDVSPATDKGTSEKESPKKFQVKKQNGNTDILS